MITEFLLARIAERERATTTIASCSEVHQFAATDLPPGVSVACAVAHYRIDPRVKAECDALRGIVELRMAAPYTCGRAHPMFDIYHAEGHTDEDPILRELAGIWIDHPAFRDEWRTA